MIPHLALENKKSNKHVTYKPVINKKTRFDVKERTKKFHKYRQIFIFIIFFVLYKIYADNGAPRFTKDGARPRPFA